MKFILGVASVALALAIPGMAQTSATQQRRAELKSISWQDQDDYRRQDRDDDRDRDHDRDRDRDRDRKRHHRDRDHDRDDDRYRNGNSGYYGNGQYGRGSYGRGGYGQYHGVLAPEWQQKFDSYYTRWLQYRNSNNSGEMSSMEGRMRDIMAHYNIPTNVPYSAVASPGIGGGGYYGNGGYPRGGYGQGGYYGSSYHGVLAPEWQQKFDSYYSRWLQYRQQNNQSEVASMEGRMRDIMTHYNIPANTPFDAVASQGAGYGRY